AVALLAHYYLPELARLLSRLRFEFDLVSGYLTNASFPQSNKPVSSVRRTDLVVFAGLASITEIVHDAGLHDLSDRPLSMHADKGFTSRSKISALVAGMAVL
ncbi:hypothetical protein, partial [Arthrobacter sp. 179]|uniref:hypothetical protein n=1 Tax=Arthrobacter sp. 179 TaxID=3457734 RepID=UPI0040336584